MKFKPDQMETQEQRMDLLSATVWFLVANGNATNDEARCLDIFLFSFLLGRDCPNLGVTTAIQFVHGVA